MRRPVRRSSFFTKGYRAGVFARSAAACSGIAVKNGFNLPLLLTRGRGDACHAMHCRAAPNFSGGSVEISWLRRIALIAPALAGAIATLALGGMHWPGILASAVILVL